jgi:predicted Zn-dependent protease
LKPRARLVKELGILLAGIGALAVVGFAMQRLFFSRPVPAPDIPRSLDDGLKPLMLKQIRAENRLVEDPAVTAAVAAILRRLDPVYAEISLDESGIPTAATGTDRLGSRPRIEVLVIDSPVVNAFTVPGGVVCVYTGLIKTLSSPEELSGILAHEMSHAAFRDPLAQLARKVGMATLAGILTGGQGETLAQGLLADLVSLRYGREAEDRADRVSVAILARAGIDPASYAHALSRIKDSARKNPGLLRYLDPHSPIDERIGRAEKEAAAAAAPNVNRKRIAVDWKKLLKALPTVFEPTD